MKKRMHASLALGKGRFNVRTMERTMHKAARPPTSEEMQAAQGVFDASLRNLLMDMDAIDEDGSRTLDYDEFSELVREREVCGCIARHALKPRWPGLPGLPGRISAIDD